MDGEFLDGPSVVRDNRLHDSLQLCALTVLFYDHLITFGSEYKCLWRRQKTRSSYWFFANRYFALFGNIAVGVLGSTSLSIQSCSRYNIARQLILIINQLFVCVLLSIRIYALYNCSVRIVHALSVVAICLLGVSIYMLFGQKSAPGHMSPGCHVALSRQSAIRLAAAWEALFIYDTLLFSLTYNKTWRARHQYRAMTNDSMPLVTLILRDGILYFAIMALANLANIVTFYASGPFLRGCLSSLASSISVTMISRLMLNLHETAHVGIYSTQTTAEVTDPIVELDTINTRGFGRSTLSALEFEANNGLESGGSRT